MNEFEQAKNDYEAIPIPEELADRVQAGIRQGRASRRRAARRPLWRTAGACAACLAVLLGALNLSPTFAKAAAEVPVLGGLFRVLTVRSYYAEEDNFTVDISQPALEGGGDLAERVNAEIAERVAAKEAEGRKIVEDYKAAFLATGGTEEEWAARPAAEVNVSYEVKSQTERTVSFVLNAYVSVFNFTEEQTFYNLDLAEDRELTLADVLGPDWVETCNDAVAAGIAAHGEAEAFFPAGEGGFTTVDETTPFYLNQAGNVVVVFPRYTIAPGYLGAVEFEIAP